MTFILIIHSLVCVLLVTAILMQSGRGGGLTDSFAAAENMFGTKTNEFMVRATSILAVIFVLTSLTLAHLYARRDQSLMERLMDKTKKPDIEINIPLDDKDAKTNASTTVPAAKDQKTMAEPVAATPPTVDVTAAPDVKKQ
ncbi:MAG: preprotein translocase subunit SecG [Candidatus Omnitrophica bacterium]|nr:preprotein translocase subunit SecG [Candidatus Omnitrophota bacterium]